MLEIKNVSKSFVKGVEGRVGGKNNPQTKEQTKTNKTTESADTKKTTAKLSNNPQVQKRAAYLTKAEIALKSEEYTDCQQKADGTGPYQKRQLPLPKLMLQDRHALSPSLP